MAVGEFEWGGIRVKIGSRVKTLMVTCIGKEMKDMHVHVEETRNRA